MKIEHDFEVLGPQSQNLVGNLVEVNIYIYTSFSTPDIGRFDYFLGLISEILFANNVPNIVREFSSKIPNLFYF